jgi:antitoxin MazE
MSMKKKLAAVGNSYGIVIDKPILDILDIDRDTELEVTTDGHRLIIEPMNKSRKQRVTEAHEKAMKKNDSTFKKLAK